jgi:hypothetical protein
MAEGWRSAREPASAAGRRRAAEKPRGSSVAARMVETRAAQTLSALSQRRSHVDQEIFRAGEDNVLHLTVHVK